MNWNRVEEPQEQKKKGKFPVEVSKVFYKIRDIHMQILESSVKVRCELRFNSHVFKIPS